MAGEALNRQTELLKLLDERYAENRGITKEEVCEKYGINDRSWKQTLSDLNKYLSGYDCRLKIIDKKYRIVKKGTSEPVRLTESGEKEELSGDGDIDYEVRKLAVLYELQKAAAEGLKELNVSKIADRLYERADGSTEKAPDSVNKAVLSAILGKDEKSGGLLKDGAVLLRKAGNENLCSIGAEIPACYSLSDWDILTLGNWIESYRKLTNAEETLKNVQLRLLEAMEDPDAAFEAGSMEAGMRTHFTYEMNGRIREVKEILSHGKETVYRYTSKKGTKVCTVQIGMAVYSEYTGKLYIVGKSSEAADDRPDVIHDAAKIDFDTLRYTDRDNEEYGKEIYRRIFDESINLSLEEPFDTEAFIDLSGNRNRETKLEALLSRHPNIRLEFMEAGQYALLRGENVRGMSELAKELRIFADGVTVLKPEKLKAHLTKRSEIALRRYLETSDGDDSEKERIIQALGGKTDE